MLLPDLVQTHNHALADDCRGVGAQALLNVGLNARDDAGACTRSGWVHKNGHALLVVESRRARMPGRSRTKASSSNQLQQLMATLSELYSVLLSAACCAPTATLPPTHPGPLGR